MLSTDVLPPLTKLSRGFSDNSCSGRELGGIVVATRPDSYEWQAGGLVYRRRTPLGRSRTANACISIIVESQA